METYPKKRVDELREKAALDPWFVTGFSDGEAAFTFSRSGSGFALYFSITQREDSKEILERIQKYFEGVGKIYRRKATSPTVNSGHTKPAAYYRICKQNELARVIEHFDRYPLQTRKQDVYQIWRAMVEEKAKYLLNCHSAEFKIFSERIATLNQKSRAFKKHSK